MSKWRLAATSTLAPVVRVERRVTALVGGRLSFPTFLCIGPPHSGTTWLYQNLLLHTEVAVPIKEPRYFDLVDRRPLLWYSALYAWSSCRALGDMSTSYSRLAPERIKVVREFMPNVRLVVILRDPSERVWSGYCRRAINPGAAKPEDVVRHVERSVTPPVGAARIRVEESEYSKTLKNWLTHFQREQLLVLRFEDICHNPQDTMVRVLDHLGVDPNKFPWKELIRHKVNANARTPMPESVRRNLDLRYSGEHQAVEELVGEGPFW